MNSTKIQNSILHWTAIHKETGAPHSTDIIKNTNPNTHANYFSQCFTLTLRPYTPISLLLNSSLGTLLPTCSTGQTKSYSRHLTTAFTQTHSLSLSV